MVYLCFDKNEKFLDVFDNSNIAKASFARTYGIISICEKDGKSCIYTEMKESPTSNSRMYDKNKLVGYIRPVEVKNHTEIF